VVPLDREDVNVYFLKVIRGLLGHFMFSVGLKLLRNIADKTTYEETNGM
jgi:hypothetical protein